MSQEIKRKDGYLDEIFDVLDANNHPCILMGRFALIWMGVGVWPDPPLELLIRNNQVDAIAAEIACTGLWEERTDDTFSIRIRSEEAARLLVDPPADESTDNDRPFFIQALCCEALNTVLLESDLHPAPEFATHMPRLLTYPNVAFLPHIRCQSASRQPQTKVYIPTIPRYVDALLAQIRWLEENVDGPLSAYGPMSDVRFLIRYLFLEMPSQRKKLLPLLKSDSKNQLEVILDRYIRTYTLKFSRAELAEAVEKNSGSDPKMETVLSSGAILLCE